MKIKPEHYNTLKTAISELGVDTIKKHKNYLLTDKEEQAKIKDIDMRLRWDCLWTSKIDIGVWYDYLNDDHIDTALRYIMHELLDESVAKIKTGLI